MKHGDTYLSKAGVEFLAIDIVTNGRCTTDRFACAFYQEGVLTPDCGNDGPPCNNTPIIFVNKEEYLTHKLLGTAESSG